ncbi:hypothetical protein M5K25_016353 [Dendrobium thyrsiflorum]|uniref:Uncharacterized protein n=1 Tax=Dendrobium thyrsiflorum TaxID=117978 RepID=A0ABD0UK20_DENTH
MGSLAVHPLRCFRTCFPSMIFSRRELRISLVSSSSSKLRIHPVWLNGRGALLQDRPRASSEDCRVQKNPFVPDAIGSCCGLAVQFILVLVLQDCGKHKLLRGTVEDPLNILECPRTCTIIFAARAAAVSAHGIESEGSVRRPYSTEAIIPPTAKRIVTSGRISVVIANTTSLSIGLSTPGKYNAEASSSGGRLIRRQRRKKNAEFRAQQQLPIHPSNLPAQEPEVNVPIRNKFTDLRWVKRNSSTGELK